MFNFKKLSMFLAIAIVIMPSKLAFSKGMNISQKLFTKSLYENSSFSIQKNKLNLIINNIHANRKKILIDSYFLNSSPDNIKTITNFNLSIKDARGNVLIDAIFPEIPLNNGINSLQGKKLILSLPNDKELDLSKIKDSENIFYEFNYNYSL